MRGRGRRVRVRAVMAVRHGHAVVPTHVLEELGRVLLEFIVEALVDRAGSLAGVAFSKSLSIRMALMRSTG